MHYTHLKILQAEAFCTGGWDSTLTTCVYTILPKFKPSTGRNLNLMFWRRGKQNCFEILCEKQPVVLEQTAACSYHSFV